MDHDVRVLAHRDEHVLLGVVGHVANVKAKVGEINGLAVLVVGDRDGEGGACGARKVEGVGTRIAFERRIVPPEDQIVTSPPESASWPLPPWIVSSPAPPRTVSELWPP